MAFLALQSRPPKFELGSRPRLALALVTSAPPFIRDPREAIQAHEMFIKIALSNPNVEMVRTAEDLKGLSAIRLGLVCGFQHAPKGLAQTDVRDLFNAGVRVMAIAYDGANEYGGGFKSGGRLTPRGEKLIRWLAEAGFILDLSHAGQSTAKNAITFIRQGRLPIRVMLSHSACQAIFQHPRNATDDIFEGVADLDGYAGIPLITFFLGMRDCDYLDQYGRHLTHALSIMGKGKVGIGSDCNHINMSMVQAEVHFNNMVKMLRTGGTLGEYFPDRPPELIEHGNNMFKILEHKLETGNALLFDPGILGLNFREFLQRSLPQT